MADASVAVHPLAPHHLPWFITAPGETDSLLVAMAIFLIVVVIGIGNVYFQLHSLPERWAHKTSPVQIQIVAVLCLLALFTHNHVFWIAALLLALVQFPDFASPMYSMAESLDRLSRRARGDDPEIDGPPRVTAIGERLARDPESGEAEAAEIVEVAEVEDRRDQPDQQTGRGQA